MIIVFVLAVWTIELRRPVRVNVSVRRFCHVFSSIVGVTPFALQNFAPGHLMFVVDDYFFAFGSDSFLV